MAVNFERMSGGEFGDSEALHILAEFSGTQKGKERFELISGEETETEIVTLKAEIIEGILDAIISSKGESFSRRVIEKILKLKDFKIEDGTAELNFIDGGSVKISLGASEYGKQKGRMIAGGLMLLSDEGRKKAMEKGLVLYDCIEEKDRKGEYQIVNSTAMARVENGVLIPIPLAPLWEIDENETMLLKKGAQVLVHLTTFPNQAGSF